MGEKNSLELHPLAHIDRTIHSPARLMVMTYLYVVDSADYLFLMRLTNLTFGNLTSHLSVLEKKGYILIDKKFIGKKPHTMIHLTDTGRDAFRIYKSQIQRVMDDLPE